MRACGRVRLRSPLGRGFVKTLILMADTRDPVNADVLTAPFYSLASVINLSYAKRHGYDYRFFLLDPGGSEREPDPSPDGTTNASRFGPRFGSRLRFEFDVSVMGAVRLLSKFLKQHQLERQTRLTLRYTTLRDTLLPDHKEHAPAPAQNVTAACRHVRWGARAPAWGKLLAVREGLLLEYDRVIYIDSDAIFAAQNVRVETFLREFRRPGSETPILTVLSNFPWMNIEANAGFMIWENSDEAKQLLETWWNLDVGRHNLDRQWDQEGLTGHLLREGKNDYRSRIAILPEVSLLEKNGQFVRHVTAPHGWERLPRMRLGLRQYGIDASRYARLVRELDCQHHRRLDTSVAS